MPSVLQDHEDLTVLTAVLVIQVVNLELLTYFRQLILISQ